MGKTTYTIWNYYHINTESGKKVGTCKFCGKKYANNATRMVHHVAKCIKCPKEIRNKFRAEIASVYPVQSSSKPNIVGQVFNVQQVPQSPHTSESETSKVTTPRATRSPSPLLRDISTTSESRSSSAYGAGCTADIRQFVDNMAPHEQEQATLSLARAIFATGTSLSVTENPYWQEAFQRIRPAFKLPSRAQLSGKLLQNEYETVKSNVETKVAEASCLSLQCDGWSNIRNQAIINFILTTPTPVLYKILPTKTERHTGEYIAEAIKCVMEEVGPNKVLSVVTDNANNMKKAWKLLSDIFPHVAFYGCFAHSLNLLMFDIMKLQSVLQIESRVVSLIKFIKGSQVISAHFLNIQREKRVEIGLTLPVKTRWGSFVKCLDSLLKNKFCIQALAVSEELSDVLPNDMKTTMLNNDVFWMRVCKLKDLLEPIAIWITKIEGDIPLLSLVPHIFTELKKHLQTEVPLAPLTRAEEEKVMAFLEARKEFSLHKCHLAANLLDPNFQGSDLSPEDIVEASEYIDMLSEHTGHASSDVLADLAHYQTKEGLWAKPFVWKCVGKIVPRVWWKGICSSSALSSIAASILSLPATSAATERSFSTYGNIHTAKRNRLTNKRAGDLVFIAHNLKLIKQQTSIKPAWRETLQPSGPSETSQATETNLKHQNEKSNVTYDKPGHLKKVLCGAPGAEEEEEEEEEETESESDSSDTEQSEYSVHDTSSFSEEL